MSETQLPEAPSEFVVEVVRVGPLTKHPNADRLVTTTVNGYPVICGAGEFAEGDRAVYVPVDSLVDPARPEFSWLKDHRRADGRIRIKAKKLRGIFSMGFLVPVGTRDGAGRQTAPTSMTVGTDMREALGVEKYQSPSELALEARLAQAGRKSDIRRKQPGMPVYGLDALRKYGDLVPVGTSVSVTEKVHGCNARYVYVGGRLWVGSHRSIRGATRHRFVAWLLSLKLRLQDLFGVRHRADLLRDSGDVWWEIARKYDLENRLREFPGVVLYGEIYGPGVQKMTYGLAARDFLAFDAWDTIRKEWLSMAELRGMCLVLGVRMVPELYAGPWDPALVATLSEGPTTLGGGHIREGIVVKTTDPGTPRVALKYASESYLLMKDGD